MRRFRYSLSLTVAMAFYFITTAQLPTAANGHFITANGLKLYYEETGTGIPLVLLHGFGRTADDWRSFTPELARHYRVLAFDLPGHGRSDYMDTTDVYLHKRAAEYLIAAFDALHLDSVYIVGHSSGSFITLYIATLRAQLVKKMVVMSGQVAYSDATRKLIASIGEPGKNPMMSIKNLESMHGAIKGPLIARQFWNFRKLYGDPSFPPDVLSSVKAKTLIIHGDNDPIAPVSNAWEMFQHIPGAHLWIVPNGGHLLFFIPGSQEEFLKRVPEFLAGKYESHPM